MWKEQIILGRVCSNKVTEYTSVLGLYMRFFEIPSGLVQNDHLK